MSRFGVSERTVASPFGAFTFRALSRIGFSLGFSAGVLGEPPQPRHANMSIRAIAFEGDKSSRVASISRWVEGLILRASSDSALSAERCNPTTGREAPIAASLQTGP